MRSGGGKQKGAQFEREVCRKLSLYVTHGKREDVFWRSAMSGGRATLRQRKGMEAEAQCGDISAVRPEGHALLSVFMIECKHVKSLDLESALLSWKGSFARFWTKLAVEANKHGKQPLLIGRQNHSKILAFLPEGVTGIAYLHCLGCIGSIEVYELDDLLHHYDPKRFE